MKKNIIYYFSGTGNSQYTAFNIGKALGNTTLISMLNAPNEVSAEEAECVGIVFPVHEWTIPILVRKFLEEVKINKKAYIFCVITCGGIVGNCLIDIENILVEKGLNLDYCKRHYSVANYVVLYNPFPLPRVAIPVSKKLLSPIIIGVLKRKKNKTNRKSKFLNRKLRQLGNKNIEKFTDMDKDFVVSSACTGCGVCVSICVNKNIKIVNGKPLFNHSCMQCMACFAYCPKQAIDYKNVTQNRTKYHHPEIKVNELNKKIIEVM